MRNLRSTLAFLAIASLVWSFGAELFHEHSVFDQTSYECTVDHEGISSATHDSEERFTTANRAHRHECFACRTGQQRPLTAGPLVALTSDQLSGETPAIRSLVDTSLLFPSGLSSRGPPSA